MPSPDDDPNMAMAKLISKRSAKPPKTDDAPPKPAEKPPKPEENGAPPAAVPPTAGEPTLTDLIGKALRFTPKAAAKPAETPPAAPGATPKPDEPPAAPPPAAVPDKKAAASRRKPPQPAIDQTAIATAAATAATEAVLTATAKKVPETPSVLETLREDDRREYAIAEHLAKTNPKYKDAPQIVLEHVNRSEEYASKWEADHPGESFDPNDEEHDKFFATLHCPWSDSEFRNAEIDFVAEAKAKKIIGEQESRFEDLAQDNARLELSPAVDRTVSQAGGTLAKLVDDEAHKALASGGYDAMHALDPVIAEVVAESLSRLEPFIKAAIEIDDPRGRIKINGKDPAHEQWSRVVTVGEAKCAGTLDEHGRPFAKRSDYVRMSEEQRRAHWFLSSEMIIQGALEYAAEEAKKIIAVQKKRLQELGYERKTGSAKPASAPAATNTPAPPTPVGVPTAVPKPVSPSAGSGPKIDASGDPPRTGGAALLDEMSKILFRS